MIILLHGTGDDDTKSENWMRWIGEIARKHGELALVLPGVASGQYKEVGDRALLFLTALERRPATGRGQLAGGMPESVTRSLRAVSALRAVLDVRNGQEADRIRALAEENQPTEYKVLAQGIRLRVAIAGLCALAYYRHCGRDGPIRIIGHSRGGAAAVGIHNLLSHYKILCDRTLTLDPCHGITHGPFPQMTFFHRIGAGTLVNLPCKKPVGHSPDITFRPPITDLDAGHATITNHQKLQHIKHGHMGKTHSLNGDSASKNRQRRSLEVNLNVLVKEDHNNLQAHLTRFFNYSANLDRAADNVQADRQQVRAAVLRALR